MGASSLHGAGNDHIKVLGLSPPAGVPLDHHIDTNAREPAEIHVLNVHVARGKLRDDVNLIDENGWTALNSAAKSGQGRVVQRILDLRSTLFLRH